MYKMCEISNKHANKHGDHQRNNTLKHSDLKLILTFPLCCIALFCVYILSGQFGVELNKLMLQIDYIMFNSINNQMDTLKLEIIHVNRYILIELCLYMFYLLLNAIDANEQVR